MKYIFIGLILANGWFASWQPLPAVVFDTFEECTAYSQELRDYYGGNFERERRIIADWRMTCKPTTKSLREHLAKEKEQ